MVTTSSLRALSVPTVGGDAGVWGNELNNTIGFLDTILGGSITFNSSASATVTLTTSEAQYNRIVFSGTPASSMVLYFSTDAGSFGNYGVWNATSTSANGGAGFNILCQVTSTSTGTTVTLPVNNMRMVNVDGQNVQYADQVIIPVITLPPVLNNYLSGLVVSNSTTGSGSSVVLSFAAGIAADTTNTTYLQNAAAFTKTASGVWAAGSGNGGMGTGLTFTAATTYHMFIISNGTSSNVDFYFDTSVTAANKPANTNYFRRVMSMKTLASAATWGQFVQFGDMVAWNPSISWDTLNNSTPNNTTIAVGLNVPTGISVIANIRWIVYNTTNTGIYWAVNDPNIVPVGANAEDFGNQYNVAASVAFMEQNFQRRTNTSGQVLFFCTSNVALYSVSTTYWYDRRGRDTVP